MQDLLTFQPDNAWVGDVIPYSENGKVYLYYLHEERESPRRGMGWNLVETVDFVHYQSCGVALEHGSETASDFNSYTGSVVRDSAGTYHLFYTGQNPRRLAENGIPLQIVKHAVSKSLENGWVKRSSEILPPSGYEPNDWRDPFVFWDSDHHEWRMLIAARKLVGPSRRRGTIAQLSSDDLETWTPIDPLWDPERFIAHECPEVFRLGEWWYLVYSEFSDSFETRYRKAHTLDGPWLAPRFDSVGGRTFYAAKSTNIGGRRLFFGWIPTRFHDDDDDGWQWAGTMTCLEAHQEKNGDLTFVPPQEFASIFSNGQASEVLDLQDCVVGALDRYDYEPIGEVLPGMVRVDMKFAVTSDKGSFGVSFFGTPDGDNAWTLRVEPSMSRMVIDRWPRKTTGNEQWQISGDVPFLIDSERACEIGVGDHSLVMYFKGDIGIFVLDNTTTLAYRFERKWGKSMGIFASDCSVAVHSFKVVTTTETDEMNRGEAIPEVKRNI